MSTLSAANLSTMSQADLIAMIERLKANQSKPRALTIKVSAKGALSVYGFGRFPVTLYASQWEKLFGVIEDIKAFIAANPDSLTRKED